MGILISMPVVLIARSAVMTQTRITVLALMAFCLAEKPWIQASAVAISAEVCADVLMMVETTILHVSTEDIEVRTRVVVVVDQW